MLRDESKESPGLSPEVALRSHSSERSDARKLHSKVPRASQRRLEHACHLRLIPQGPDVGEPGKEVDDEPQSLPLVAPQLHLSPQQLHHLQQKAPRHAPGAVDCEVLECLLGLAAELLVVHA
eukprot:CAMPEP_0173397428 /NCGR_PEP_ID=MMETSP1356-20130122/38372_1 /TAXON_ID=77927 ORGANISM="Hemiselmis virescens, Strain PCC157" /NCGR_SAMPLE_ID=MMETSP1356 /ASSEMBLY_ACC=CAM_ASM_000847 /LENGTH=121 /DNA_ID=CAMNT_0014356693 /DNA_START=393 /DNA_END=755 /DNA_ORIENTATION=-